MPPEARINEEIPVKLIVPNTGSGTARNVIVTDYLPDRLSALGNDNRILRFEVGDLTEGQSKTIEFKNNLGTYRNLHEHGSRWPQTVIYRMRPLTKPLFINQS